MNDELDAIKERLKQLAPDVQDYLSGYVVLYLVRESPDIVDHAEDMITANLTGYQSSRDRPVMAGAFRSGAHDALDGVPSKHHPDLVQAMLDNRTPEMRCVEAIVNEPDVGKSLQLMLDDPHIPAATKVVWALLWKGVNYTGLCGLYCLVAHWAPRVWMTSGTRGGWW